MGLDMELRLVSKPHLDPNSIYKSEEINGIVIPEDQIDLPMYRELRPYTQKLQVVDSYWELDKLRSDYGLSRAHMFACPASAGFVCATRTTIILWKFLWTIWKPSIRRVVWRRGSPA